jgi:endonuclease V-like protein UPF0215 family
MRRAPDLDAVNRALARLPRSATRRALMDRAGPIHRAGPALVFQCAGADPDEVGVAICASVVHGHVPECLRAAHLIASGIVTGESGHRA